MNLIASNKTSVVPFHYDFPVLLKCTYPSCCRLIGLARYSVTLYGVVAGNVRWNLPGHCSEFQKTSEPDSKSFWILNFEFWILNFEFWILNFEFWILNFELWILNFEFWILKAFWFSWGISNFPNFRGFLWKRLPPLPSIEDADFWCDFLDYFWIWDRRGTFFIFPF